MQFSGKQFLVLGLGDTGVATVRWLLAHGATVSVADSRAQPPQLAAFRQEFPDVAFACGPFTAEQFTTADEIVASPGVAVASLPTTRTVIGDIELFARAIVHMPTTVIAITGSNGKSTVTSMVGDMCAAAGLKTVVAGNIGLPVLAALSEAEAAMAGGAVAPQVYVLELSSFQLETTHSLHATAATVLNVTEDHMDRYADLTAYAIAKARVFLGDGVQVLNRDDPWSAGLQQFGRVCKWFALSAPQFEGEYGIAEQGQRLALLNGPHHLLWADELQVTGLHNVANALAAIALCQAIDLPLQPILTALKQFKGLPHRVEKVRTIKQVSFYDDSKGTNVGATVAALNGIDKPVILIAGGDGKGQDFMPLRPAIDRICKAVVLIGRDGPQIRAIMGESDVMVLSAVDMDEAVRLAWSQAVAGDVVLLSPACASLDMFRNYGHRAQVFIDAVLAIAEQEGAG